LQLQDLTATGENIRDYGIDDNQLKLLFEDENTCVILNDGGQERKWINVIWKDADRQMETIEL